MEANRKALFLRKIEIKIHPKRRDVRARVSRICRRIVSASARQSTSMPSPPALHTAAARAADLLKLFVEPSVLRSGTGKALLAWATDVAKKLGAKRLTIEADPDAAPFYRRMGAYDVGQAPSGSVPGRMLPKLAMDLCSAD